MPDWKGLVTNWLAYAGVVVVSLLATYLRTRGSRWIDPIIYGLVAGGLSAFILVELGFIVLPSQVSSMQPAQQVTPDNIEAQTMRWSDTFRLGTKKMDVGDSYFARTFTLPDGHTFLVRRTKNLDRYLIFSANITLAQDILGPLARLSHQDQDSIVRQLRREFARFHIQYENVTLPFTMISISRFVPISDALTESSFVQNLEDMDFASAIGQETIITALEARHVLNPP